MGTYGDGIWYYKDGVWAHQGMPRGKENEVWRIAQDRSGTIWFGTSLGITRYEAGEWKFCEDEDGIGNPNTIAPGYSPGMFTGEVWALIIDRHDHVWAGTFRGVSRFDGKSWRQFTTADGLGEGGVGDLYEDRDGTIWAGGPVWSGAGGFCRFDGDRWINVRPGATGPIIEDAAGNLWMAKSGGLSRFDRRHWQVVDTRWGLPGGHVLGLERDHQGRILIAYGPDDGEVYTKGKAGISALPKSGIVRYDGHTFAPIELPGEAINSTKVFEDSKTNLWIAGSSGNAAASGSFVWRLADGQWLGYGKKDGLDDWLANAFAEDAAGRVWIGGSLNVTVFDGKTFEKQGGFVANDWAKDVTGMALDRKGKMWIATAGHGVWRFDGEGDDGFMHWATFNQTNGLPQDGTTCILVDRKDRVWIGTRSSGVARYDGSRWKVWDEFDGLARNYVADIKEDRDGLIWLAQGNAVSVFDGTAWSSLDERDGLSIDCRTLLPESDGSMWLGGRGGLQRYTRQHTELAAPTLRLTGDKLEQSGSALQPPAIKQGTRLTFEFAAQDFLTDPAKLQFRYLMSEGNLTAEALKKDAAWSAPTTQRRLEWSTNRVGTYSVAVQFIDRDLNYSKPALATITIVPFWYRNAAIMAPAGSALLGLVGWSGLLTLRFGRKRRETERLREQMLMQEKRAREALEAKNAQLASARDAAESANHAKSLFLANMSHEIRTPMNAILGYSQILRRDDELPPKYRSSIETIEKSGDHLLAMINDILDLSKIEAGRMELQETDFDLTSLILGLKAMFKVRCQEQDLKLEVEGLGDSPCPVHADEGKLRQVLINLLGNAVKFTDRGGVTLRVITPRSEPSTPPKFRFEIIDTGQGISPEAQARLFQPFQQSAEGMKKGGTGLGLAITKRQVELMGGTITLESQVGRGSRFCIEVPLAPAQSEVVVHHEQETRQILGLAEGCHVKVLVVDDVRQNRDVLSKLLRGIGCEVETADGGVAALEKLRAAIPDIVFMDIRMPDMEGPEVLRRFFAELGRGRTKLVALSASVLAHEQESYIEAGFDAFIGKPFRFEEICRCMKRLLPVEFRYAEAPASLEAACEAVNPADVRVSPELKEQLREAAERYSVTKLERGFEALSLVGEIEKRAASYLRALAQQGNFDAVADFLKAVNHG
jgi:signal transduction histidine kinase/ligand-binding sensor domain-containing protein/DNA-binding response OmpR family regulator